jgi:hypothetical protein
VRREEGKRKEERENRKEGTPVKSASLVFFEEFNWASRK